MSEVFVQAKKIETTEDALNTIFNFMKDNQVANISMVRHGSGDSGDSANFEFEMMDRSADQEVIDSVEGRFDELSKVVDWICCSNEDRVEADYNNEGGEFTGELCLSQDEAGQWILLNSGTFNYFSSEEDEISVRSIEKDDRLEFFSPVLGEEKTKKLIEAMDRQTGMFSVMAVGSGDSGDECQQSEGFIKPEDEEVILESIQEYIDGVDEGTFNDAGGGFSFTHQADGTMSTRHWFVSDSSSYAGSFSDKYKVDESGKLSLLSDGQENQDGDDDSSAPTI